MDSPTYRAIVERGQIVWQDAEVPPAPWWSLSKTAIAAAALVLVQRERFDLDNPQAGRNYTLRQLLQHTAGLPDYGGLVEYHQSVASGWAPWTDEELFDRVDVTRLRSVPGQRFAYSNVGYLIVRRMIEEATGLDLGRALNDLVFGPLELEDVRVATVPADLTAAPWAHPAGYHPGWVFHGLVVGSPAQAALFLGRLFSGDLLNASLLETMRQPFSVSETSIPNRPWNSAAYGLGLMIDLHSPHGPCYGHTGSGPSSTTATYWFGAMARPRAVSVFAGIEDQGKVESEALALAGYAA